VVLRGGGWPVNDESTPKGAHESTTTDLVVTVPRDIAREAGRRRDRIALLLTSMTEQTISTAVPTRVHGRAPAQPGSGGAEYGEQGRALHIITDTFRPP